MAALAGLAGLAADTTTSASSPLAIGLSIIVVACCAALGWIVGDRLEFLAVRRGVLRVATRTSRTRFTHIVSVEDPTGRPSERGFMAISGHDQSAWSVAEQRWASRPEGATRAAIYLASNSWRGPRKDVLVGWVDENGQHDATATSTAKETHPCSDH